MLLGPPTTTPAIPTRTPDPSLTTTTEKPLVPKATTSTTTSTTPGSTLGLSNCEKHTKEINRYVDNIRKI